jgi:hypothetical protein
MSMPTTTVHGPVVTLGPRGSGFLSVDESPEDALTHLESHRSATSEVMVPDHDELTFFDGRARLLRLDTTSDRPRLRVTDEREHEGELRSRVDEAFADARERAYRNPSLLTGSDVTDPAMIQPPADPALDDYLFALRFLMSAREPKEDHAGSWLHNLFHRLG